MASPSVSNLCLDCGAVDFSTTPSRDELQVLREIGPSSALSPTGTCELCDIMNWMLDAPPNGIARDNLSLIRSTSFEAGKGEGYDYRQPDRWPHGFIKIARPSDIVEHWGRPYHDISDIPRFATFTDSPNPDRFKKKRWAYCMPGTVNPGRLDCTAIHSWLQYCSRSHDHCKPSSHPELPIRVIDCMMDKVVQAPKNSHYTTLSYVWGTSPDDSEVSDGGSLINLPVTIRDALSLTIALGYRYIWIDRYCIDQKNPAEKLAQIQQMGDIYQASSLTIFAACGTGPRHGLPGVGETPRQIQIKREIYGREMVGLLDHPRKLIRGSVWMQRGWTYQEAMLSRRRLFLTDQQAYFECRHDFVRDEIYGLGEPLYSGDSGLGLRMAPGAPNQSMFKDMTFEWSTSTQIFRYISDYSRRQLTFESDRLFALLGVLNVVSELKYPVFHLQGIPIITSTPAPRNCWGPQVPRPVWSITTAFMVGMTWNVEAGMRRNQEFPSWSWISWAGAVSWGGNGHSEPRIDGITDTSALFSGSVWIEDSSGRIRGLETYRDEGNTLGLSLPRIIHVESETYEVNLIHLSNSLEGCYTFGDNHYRYHESGQRLCAIPAGDWATWEADSTIRSYISFNSFDVGTTLAMAKSYKVLVVLCGSQERQMMGGFGATEGKVLRMSGENYEVIGHISLSVHSVYFKPSETSGIDVSRVTRDMVLPKMKRERVCIV
ncbi:HET-domain-containing protein [Trematosphaeria pertusa]|uniref:HET-domain-containing protein n=1 Tax=Trematosphaeria pertusa TaxID=390896 RepID=A0A6A6HXZ9_9PLEO|nr:HET-domain-containing protein [Trematosphaeria pertusa]KAF2242759.1 HET-domain-containing protein [Trematosphaeria pertusa]